MTDTPKKKLSREEVAKIEIGNTQVSTSLKYFLTVFFLLFIGIYPVCQFFYSSPLKEIKKEATLQKSFKQYETAIEDSSLLRAVLLNPIQKFLISVLGVGNEKVVLGSDGWLFFQGDFEYLDNPGFLNQGRLHKRFLEGSQPDPLSQIKKFNAVLKERGIKLILLPIPVKPMIYPEMLKAAASAGPVQNKSFAVFLEQLNSEGITVLDFSDDFVKMKQNGIQPYLKTDTHWTPEAMRFAAKKLSALIGKPEKVEEEVQGHEQEISSTGDIAKMFRLPDVNAFFPEEKVKLVQYDYTPDRNSDVLLLGDSFTNIYSLEAMGWGTRAGFAETLAHELGKPIDVIARNDAGAHATRDALANEYRHGRDRLAGKKFVVWEFAIRELVNGDWTDASMKLVERGESEFLTVTEPKLVIATVLGISHVPRPFSAPYEDHVMSIHLGDIDGTNAQALVFAISMKKNVHTGAAKLRIGDTILIQLSPWEDVEEEYGNWNRSEFSDDDLLLQEPCWGEINFGTM